MCFDAKVLIYILSYAYERGDKKGDTYVKMLCFMMFLVHFVCYFDLKFTIRIFFGICTA